MKRFFSFVLAAALSLCAFAQTPEEIVKRMEEVVNAHEKEGVIMDVDIKIPLLGTMTTRTYTLGVKTYMEASVKGEVVYSWSDQVTSWTYDSASKELTIENASSHSSSEGDAEMFTGVTEGYDLKLQKETPEAWFFKCKRSRNNPDKDAPKSFELAVCKDNYYPYSLTAKESGVTMTMRNISFGVSEEQVTFNQADYPDAKVIDKR